MRKKNHFTSFKSLKNQNILPKFELRLFERISKSKDIRTAIGFNITFFYPYQTKHIICVAETCNYI